MRPETTLVRTPSDRHIPKTILTVQAREPHRPRSRYRLVIRGDADAEAARQANLPVFPLRDDIVTMLGYPMRFRTILVVPRSVRSAIDSALPVVEFLAERAVMHPRVEDIMVAMLRFDSLAARALIRRNLDHIDKVYLAKRIYQEDLEPEATRVRLHELIPISPSGASLPAEAIEKVDRSNLAEGIVP